MTEAVDVLHAIERLVALAQTGPAADGQALQEANAVLVRMGMDNGATGYRAEKLSVVRDGFAQWFGGRNWAEGGDDTLAFRAHLQRDIEHLRKALARGSAGQD
jgi:hypothetical protein